MNLFIGCSFFLSEITIIWICYKFIYKKKNTTNKSFWDFFRMIIGYYFFMMKYRFQISARNRDMDDFLQQYRELRYTILEKSVFGVAEVIVLPVIVVLMIKYFYFPWAPFLIYIAGISVFLDSLKKSRIVLMSLMNESQKFLYKFDRKKNCINMDKTAKKEKHVVPDEQEKEKNNLLKTVLVLLMIACGDITMILVLRNIPSVLKKSISETFHIKDTVFCSPFFIAMVLLTLLLYFFFLVCK